MDNLKPGIPYTIGVILVSEDGNYNIEDIKTVNYSTSCLSINKNNILNIYIKTFIQFKNIN